MRHALVTLQMSLPTRQTAGPHAFGFGCGCLVFLLVLVLVVVVVVPISHLALALALDFDDDMARTHALDLFTRLRACGMWRRFTLVR